MIERTFRAVDRFGANMEFELIEPTLAIENEAERQYRIAYGKAMAEGIFPREKLREIMKQHEMWTDDDDQSIKNITTKLAILTIELERLQIEGDRDKCIEKAKEMSEARNRMWELFVIQQSVYLNSAEHIAEIIKNESIMASCTVIKASRQRYWKNYMEFVQERDEHKTSTVYIEAMNIQNKLLDELRTNLLNEYPEVKYINTINQLSSESAIKEVHKRAETAIEKIDKPKKKKNGKMDTDVIKANSSN